MVSMKATVTATFQRVFDAFWARGVSALSRCAALYTVSGLRNAFSNDASDVHRYKMILNIKSRHYMEKRKLNKLMRF